MTTGVSIDPSLASSYGHARIGKCSNGVKIIDFYIFGWSTLIVNSDGKEHKILGFTNTTLKPVYHTWFTAELKCDTITTNGLLQMPLYIGTDGIYLQNTLYAWGGSNVKLPTSQQKCILKCMTVYV